MARRRATRWRAGGLALVLAVALGDGDGAAAAGENAGGGPASASPRLELHACRLDGWPHEARCGRLRRPLDPSAPGGRQIEIEVAVVPALAQQPAPAPVFFFAGGPGQSAIDLAGALARRFTRLSNRRDLVFIDQRGTGRSAPLRCPDDEAAAAWQPLPDDDQRIARLQDCRRRLEREPHGDLRMYTTAIAVDDVDAVRAALGAERIDAIGFSYGTRVALEFQRRFPDRVRRMVLDGVVAPDLRLPRDASASREDALRALLDDCARDAGCARRFPDLDGRWQQLLAGLPREVRIDHPLTGQPQSLTLSVDTARALVGAALYVPALAAGLPQAISEAADGRFGPLLALAMALGSRHPMAGGMHFSVVCAEDMPAPGAASEQARVEPVYEKVCAHWQRAPVPEGFRNLAPSRAPVLLLSGSVDPVTPPRHAQRVAAALGEQARHVVVGDAGHGVLALACARDAAVRFIAADTAAQARSVSVDCPPRIGRPPAFVPPGVGR